MTRYRVISSDDHILEPADLWTTRIEPKFRDRAPHVVRLEGTASETGGDWWFCDGAAKCHMHLPGHRLV